MPSIYFSACLVSLAFLSSLATGCADPKGEFDAFCDRANPDRGCTAATIETDAGACTPPAPGEGDGTFFFALSSTLGPELPITFIAQVRMVAFGDGTGMKLDMQALTATDRQTLVGPMNDFGPFPISAEGELTADLPPITTVAPANPLTNREIEADVALTGQVCAGSDFHCGYVTGEVTQPLQLALDGSTWTMERVTDGDPTTYPEPPKINCAEDLATTVDRVNPQ
jgi:hypothetical protein